MASLEELLAEEGFQGGKMMQHSARTSLGLKAVSMPLYLDHEKKPLRIKTERTRSEISQHELRIKSQKNERARSRTSRNNVHETERWVAKSKENVQEIEIEEESECGNPHEDDGVDLGFYENLRETSRYKVRNNTEFQAYEKSDDERSKNVHGDENSRDRYVDEFQEDERLKDKHLNYLEENDRYEERIRKGLPDDERYRRTSKKHLTEKMNFSKISQNRSLKGNNKSGELQSQRQPTLERMVSEPALDEVAVQAIVSILGSYIRRFLKDETFRSSLHQNCISCLGFAKSKELYHADSGVIVNLNQAIQTVERVAEKLGDPKELKKAALQLSVIAGLNSKDLKDELTSGIPNSHLAACAHLYLSVIYKLQKKDRISAKHLLQAFCDSPFQTRMSLLPDLWDQLFLPHLSHLRVWYDQEAEAIPNTSSKLKKLELLEKMYNEMLDSGTYQFAVYYKEWLTAGVEAPAVPAILIPATSLYAVSQGGSHGSPEPDSNSVGSIASQPMVSKRLYEAVFGRSNKLDSTDEVKDGLRGGIFGTVTTNIDGTTEEDIGTFSPETGTYVEQCTQEDPRKTSPEAASPHADGLLLTSENAWQSHQVAIEVKELEEESDNTKICQNIFGCAEVLNLPSHTKANELTLKNLAKSIFQRQTEDSSDSFDATLLHSNCMPVLNLFDKTCTTSCTSCYLKKSGITSTTLNVDLPTTDSSAGLCYGYEYFDERSFFSTIPKDFICPLTSKLFEDPVTLETGHTFDRIALKEWLDQGNRTCPVTGKTLGSIEIPTTNFVLKHIIDGWKSERLRNPVVVATQIAGCSVKHGYGSKDEAALFILEQFLINFNSEAKTENAKHLIALGGLQFLLWRFDLGDLEEKTRASALISCCIEADGGCRHYIARNINKACLIKLLHSKNVISRKKAVLLLTELICLNRRTMITSFLNGLQKEGIMNTMHVLLVYLQTSAIEQKPLVAVLLLHFDLLVEPQKYSIYREEAVDAIIAALDCSLVDVGVNEQCCRALLIMGGHFSYSGELLTETRLLKLAGFFNDHCTDSLNTDEDIQIDISWEEDERANEEWLRKLAALLLSNGKKSFLESISKCLSSENPDLVRTCLTTVAWLSRSLSSITDADFQLSAFSSLIPQLKQKLENERVEHRVLASLSLLNFSEISECRVLLMTFAEEIVVPLHDLAEVTWTAKQLLSIIS